MLAVVCIRGRVGTRRDMEDTLKMLGLKRKHTLAILPRTDAIIGMIKKVESYVTWGEISEEMKEKSGGRKIIRLNPPQKGFRSLKQRWPKGDIGYRGKEINELIKRMM